MLKTIAMLSTTVILVLAVVQSYAISPGAGQAQVRNSMQEMQQNKQRGQQMRQNQQQIQQRNPQNQKRQENSSDYDY